MAPRPRLGLQDGPGRDDAGAGDGFPVRGPPGRQGRPRRDWMTGRTSEGRGRGRYNEKTGRPVVSGSAGVFPGII